MYTYCSKYCFSREEICFVMPAGSKTVSIMDALASHIVHVSPFVRLRLSPEVFGSVQGPALEEGQAGEFVTISVHLGQQAYSKVRCS